MEEEPDPATSSGIFFNAAHCDYEVVTQAARRRGWRIIRSKEKAARCQVHWIDDNAVREWMPRIEAGMLVNHFPGMFDNLGRKSGLARNIARMQRYFPTDFRFVPTTWVLPYEFEALERHYRSDSFCIGRDAFIVKPDNLCQGKGIFLTNDIYRVKQAVVDHRELPTVVQLYISRPMLIDGFKFDLRLYLLVCGFVQPSGLQLSSFLFKDGLVRLCTLPYEPPTEETFDQQYMHLTNYSINKKNCDFQKNVDPNDEGSGSKRSLRWFLDSVAKQYGEQEQQKLWEKLSCLCVKLVAAVEPALVAEYASFFPKDVAGQSAACRCFQVLGVDVMLDERRRPYLIEVNTLPSFEDDSPLDEEIKTRLVQQAFDLGCASIAADCCSGKGEVASPAQGAAGVANRCDPSQEEFRLLPELIPGLEAHGDFERVFPPTPKFVEQCEAILTQSRDSFRSLHNSRRLQKPTPCKVEVTEPKKAPRPKKPARRKNPPMAGPPRCASVGLHSLASRSPLKSQAEPGLSRSKSGPSPGLQRVQSEPGLSRTQSWATAGPSLVKPRDMKSQVRVLNLILSDQESQVQVAMDKVKGLLQSVESRERLIHGKLRRG